MGDAADMILDGTLCESCGEYIGPGDGIPAQCRRCSPNPAAKRERRDRAEQQYHEAAALASAHGLRLSKCSDTHYQLSVDGGWLMNLYPGKTRIWPDPNRPKAPWLDLAGVRWELIDVVRLAVEKQESPA